MKIIEFIGNSTILLFILITFLYGIIEHKNILDLFFKGVIEAERIVIDLFPTFLALIVSVGMLNSSGFINFISNILNPIFSFLKIEKELFPLILIRPISASTTTAIATEIMKQYGVDSKIGLIASCIMGSTETTIYVIYLYSSKLKLKSPKELFIIGLTVDFIGILVSCLAYNIGLML